MKTLWVLVVLAGVSLADLPSCERARCSHCEVKFIAKVCKKTCDACPQTITEVNLESRLKSFYEEKDRLSQANKEYYKGTKTQKPLKKGPVTSTARQTGVPSLAGLKEPREVRFQQPYHYAQYAAPQTGQVPVVQYPQQQPFPGVSTLAPLLPALRPTEINSNLASQPADLAQPLPEYGRSTQIQSGFQLQQPPTQYQSSAAAPTPYYNTNQNPFPSTSFSQPTYQPAQQSQSSVQYPQQQPTSPLLNPFQPFMQQVGAGSAQSLLDPFGLFNLGALAPVTPAPNPFAPPQTGFGSSALTNQQPLQQPTLAQQQPSQGSYLDQTQQLQYDQQRQVNYNYNTQTYPGQQQQVPAVQQQQQRLQNVYGQQNTNYNAQQQQQQRGSQQVNQQALPQYRVNQPQLQQQRLQVQGSNALPRLPSSPSIDAPPINVQKYVDGKGSVPQPPPQQCPRQPGWAPCITKQQANERFTNCCARLGDGCTPLCNYDAPLATMQLAVLTGRCPLNKMADIMVCASGYEDATACCEAYNVFEPGYEQCRPYCNPAAGLPQGGLLSEKYKCLAKLSHIQQCFYVSQKP